MPMIPSAGRVFWDKAWPSSIQFRNGKTDAFPPVDAAEAATGKPLWHAAVGSVKAIAQDTLYCYHSTGGGWNLSAVDAKTGKVVRERQFNPTESSLYHLDRLLWSPRHRLLFGQEQQVGPGTDIRSLRVVKPNLMLAWKRQDTGRFELIEDVLVCEEGQGRGANDYYRHIGLVGLSPETGRVLWRRPKGSELLGVWNGVIVERQPDSPQLFGLSPRTGRVLWTLLLPANWTGSLQVYDRWLVIALRGKSGQPARLQAYLPAK